MDFWVAGDLDWVITLQPHTFGLPMQDVHVAVNGARMNEMGAYGLVCRSTGRNDLYGFHITNDGRYWVCKMLNGTGTTLASGAGAPATSDVNRIEMRCVGQTITSIIDGTTAEEINDDSLSEGNVGLFAQPLGGPLEGGWSFYAYFDDFQVEVMP